MNKKGFTLIELLAVIVILAIIALIATPIVLDIIKESKESSELRSAEFYIEAVQYSLAQSILNNQTINDGTYDILETGNLCLQYNGDKCINELVVKINGESPKEGKITISNGQIYSIITKFNNKNIAKYKDIEPSYTTHKPGDIVYFNVSTGETCDESESVSATGTKSGCMKFYVIKDLGGALDLILDHNTTSKIEWVINSDYLEAGGNQIDWDNNEKINFGPVTLIKQLYNDTKEWKGTETQINYTLDQRGQVSNAYYVIEYSEVPDIEGAKEPYKARIISAGEVAEITGAYKTMNWRENVSDLPYSLSSLTDIPSIECTDNDSNTECKFGWLYDRTGDCTNYGCNVSDSTTNGYWTISSRVSYSYSSWFLHKGGITSNPVYTLHGVRPVITILKTKIS